MNRTSLNITLTAPMIRANLKQRLDMLAARTDLPATTIAGRVLLFGLPHLEADLTLLFAAAAEPPIAAHSATVPTASVGEHSEAQHGAAQPPLSAAPASTSEDKPAPAAAVDPATAPRADMKPAPALRAASPDRVSSRDAARALKKKMPAFNAHLHRHPELKRHAKIVGHAAMWDLAGLRAEWVK